SRGTPKTSAARWTLPPTCVKRVNDPVTRPGRRCGILSRGMISARLSFPVLAGPPPPTQQQPEPRRGEIINKTPGDHAAEAGFALASSAAVLGPVGRTSQMIPGLNLGVGLLETHNALASHRKKDHTAMLGHAGNALGCYASFAEDAGRLM